jgi:hypothetical protein
MQSRYIKPFLLATCGILFFGIAAFFSASPDTLIKLDMTKEKIHSLSNASLEVVQNAKRKRTKINVKGFFANGALSSRFQEVINLYQSKGAPIEVTLLDPKTSAIEAKKYGIESDANVAFFESNDKKSRIEIVNEEKITNAIAKVIQSKESPRMLVIAGHGETPMTSAKGTGFAKYFKILTEAGYALEEKVLSNLSNTELDHYPVVLLLDPQFDLSESSIAKLESVAQNGGSIYLTLGAWKFLPNLQDWVASKGILINNDALILDPRDSRASTYGAGNAVLSSLNSTNRITRFLGSTGAKYGVLLPDSRSLSLLEPKDKRVFRESLGSTGRPTMILPDVESPNRRKFNAKELLDKQPAIAAFAYRNYADKSPDQNRKFKLVVLGSSSFANNTGYQNPILREMFLNSMSYLSDAEDFIAIAQRTRQPPRS